VVDDSSPDGTGRLADELAAADAQIKVLHRTAKDGLGAAYLAGFRRAIAQGYDVMVEMDADGSHQPNSSPACSRRWSAPIWSSGPGGCPAARWRTGPNGARSSRAAPTPTPG